MKTIVVIIAALIASVAWAQQQSVPQPVLDMEGKLRDVGCSAERLAAAQEITRLQQVNDAIQKQLTEAQKKSDPPSDPATATPTIVPSPFPTPSPYENPAWTPMPPSAVPTQLPAKKK